ncbi:hypothetical protein SETIT_5G188400v2 [Setaria italica]|uniref:Uncharacterized protein n=1 Tax=Setaria italica TaxID=4555 RepID=A0A368R695_SETIT|nr:hypothetical protein SETIT_5G188400v2 [Setaria italica]
MLVRPGSMAAPSPPMHGGEHLRRREWWPEELTQVDDGTDYGRMGVSDGDDDLGGRIQLGTTVPPFCTRCAAGASPDVDLYVPSTSTYTNGAPGCNFRLSVCPPSLAHAASSTRRAMAAGG